MEETMWKGTAGEVPDEAWRDSWLMARKETETLVLQIKVSLNNWMSWKQILSQDFQIKAQLSQNIDFNLKKA